MSADRLFRMSFVTALILLPGLFLIRAQSYTSQKLLDFMGRRITVTAAATDPDGFFPKGPATVCIDEPPQRRCHTAARDYGRDPG